MKARLAYGFLLFFFLLTISGVRQLSAQDVRSLKYENNQSIHADSNVFIGWAISCEVNRGWMQINRLDLGFASYGNDVDAAGKADNFVVSLGDGGTALLRFEFPLTNGPGPDFAVFENSFNDSFLELAHVEASSDGVNFIRFPSVSLTQTQNQVQSFGTLESENINNLAGKYPAFYGVPFDLSDVEFSDKINVNLVTHIRIIDVVGSIDTVYCSRDSEGRIINDPWPTPFPSSGFDLDAIGVIHDTRNLGMSDYIQSDLKISPNPFKDCIELSIINNVVLNKIEVFEISGKQVYNKLLLDQSILLDLSFLRAGIYLVKVTDSERTIVSKIIKR
jgi:hypothetical protein